MGEEGVCVRSFDAGKLAIPILVGSGRGMVGGIEAHDQRWPSRGNPIRWSVEILQSSVMKEEIPPHPTPPRTPHEERKDFPAALKNFARLISTRIIS